MDLLVGKCVYDGSVDPLQQMSDYYAFINEKKQQYGITQEIININCI